jgi:hypothetical protein
MDKEDIIRMAREAVRLPEPQTPQEEAIERALAPIFERFAALVAKHEREACARLCEELLSMVSTGDEHMDGVADCIAAIRARGQA